MPWGIAISAGASLLGSSLSADAAGDAADQQSQAAANGQAIQQQEYNQTRADLSPYNALGTGAIGSLQALNNGNYSGFENSPDYKFALSQGENSINQGAAARGNLFTGGNQKDLASFNQGTASQYLGNYRNSLMSQIGIGANAASGQAGANQSYANQSSNLYNQSGQAQALGTLGQSSAYNNGINQVSNALGQYFNPYGSSYSASSIPDVNPSYSSVPTISY